MKPHYRDHLAGRMVVWIARVSQARESLVFLEHCLDGGDRGRAARFRFPDDRARFVLGRGLLRKCLGHYLQQAAETIELLHTDRGRPILPQGETVEFSVSHTRDLVAIAVTDRARIGIDLEYVRASLDLPELAERIFSEEDLRTFRALPGGDAPVAFFRAWTRKEAYLKARGEGIAEELRRVSVSFGPEKTGSVRDARDHSAARSWRLLTLPVPADYIGSLACDDSAKRFEYSFVHFDQGEPVRNFLPQP